MVIQPNEQDEQDQQEEQEETALEDLAPANGVDEQLRFLNPPDNALLVRTSDGEQGAVPDAAALAEFADATFAERFQWLMNHVHDPETGALFSDNALAKRISDLTAGQVKVNQSTIWHIRNGNSTPRWTFVLAVAKAFGRTLRFFTEPNFAEVIRRSDEEDRFVKAMQRNGIKNMLLRAADLPDESLTPLITIIEQVGEIIRQQQALIPPPPRYKRKAKPAADSDGHAEVESSGELTNELEESADGETSEIG